MIKHHNNNKKEYTMIKYHKNTERIYSIILGDDKRNMKT